MTDGRNPEAERLSPGEEHYRRLFEEAQEGIMITSPEGTILDANPAARELTGYLWEELIGMSAEKLCVYPEERDTICRRLADDGEFRNLEMHLRPKGNQVIICRLSASVIRDADENIEAFRFYAHDITEQRQAREALEESERKFRQLAEQSVVGISLIQDGKFQYVNPQAAEMFGYEPQELTAGMGPEDTIHPDDWPRVKENIQKRLSGEKEAVGYQFRGVCKNGETIFVEVYGRRISVGGRPAVLSHLLEVTERRRLRNQLLDVQEEERRRLGQELHDTVASQMTGIAMILSSYESRLEAGEPLSAEEVRRVKKQVQEGEAETRRLSHGLHPGSLEEASVTEALGELARSIDDRFSGRCVFEGGRAADLDPQEALHLYRIAQEAATNALRHGDPETIRVALSRSEEELVLTVIDDGQGFTPEEIDEGLGLSSMRHRAEMLGGNLSVDSVPGRGTTVRCQLPVDLT